MSRFPEKILLATDGSEDAALALNAAVDLSARAGSELHVVHVWRAFAPRSEHATSLEMDARLHEREAWKLLRGQVEAAEAAVGGKVTAHLKEGRPAEAISGLAEGLGAGLIVLGSRGVGPVERLVMGSVSEGVVDLAPCPVLLVRGGRGAWPPSRVVVGDDSSGRSKKAGELAAIIANLVGATMLLVRAFPVVLDASDAARVAEDVAVPPGVAMGRHEASLLVRAMTLERRFGRRPRTRVREGEAASVILEATERGGEGPALVAVGRRGLGALDRLRLGSVSTKVLRAAPGPVLVCPA
jgi:nucleotide-binding universal stress UspA family protein